MYGVLLTRIFPFARPRSSIVIFSSVRPTSSAITWPPVRIAMSSSIRLAALAKSRRLDCAAFTMPRIVLTTRVASASPSTSSAMISNGCRLWRSASSTGSTSRRLAIFLSGRQDVRHVPARLLLRLLVADEVRRQVAAVELPCPRRHHHCLRPTAVLHRDHAFLADFSIALAMMSPMSCRRSRRSSRLGDFLAGGARLCTGFSISSTTPSLPCRCRASDGRVHAGG